ncbi:hypothetical protein GCM10027449_04220 [Sinomonas notoginsengisoli]|uniref:DUF3027 domain-containing protein n=1 Tax=Sinomonas notoginsengisoli TaxID=1457311 RepID=UPI001F19035E|nr:DUF3027 domain-containing protein [Sinomonas notoginsengisoli]
MTDASVPAQTGAAPAPKRKTGVPVWRVGKPDSFLAAAAAVDTARAALADIARPEDIGEHLAAKSEGERVVTHLFTSLLPGYRGWQWYVTMARITRSKVATVSEIGLVPSDDAVLAPEWVPWSERVRPEERAAEQPAASEEPTPHDGEGEPSEGTAPEAPGQSETPAQPDAGS